MLLLVAGAALIWGSFLNCLAYRLVTDLNFWHPRSVCPSCNHPIALYDLIPLFSWFFLKGRCRSCTAPISWLYPFIELSTLGAFCAAWQWVPHPYLLPYLLFFSALIVTLRTDAEFFLISRYVTLYLLPFFWLCAYLEYIPLTLAQSLIGSATAYSFLAIIGYLFLRISGRQGIGEGDYDLLCFIGTVLGCSGWWFSLLLGSLVGSMCGILYSAVKGTDWRSCKLPFGAFLSLAAMAQGIVQFWLSTT